MNDERQGFPSASSWHRYELCAGSYQLEREARELGQLAHQDSPAASRGERIHAWLAGIPDEDGNEIQLSAQEQTTADLLIERTIEERNRIFGDAAIATMTEERLWLSVGALRLSGRVDRVYYTAEQALVIDYKTGFSEPDRAEINAQLKVLAILVALRLPSIKFLTVQIIPASYRMSEATYNMADLKVAYNEVAQTLAAINEPEPTFAPSPEACRYCPGLNVCQAVKDLIMPIARLPLAQLPDGERAAKLLDEVSLLERHLAAIREYYSTRLSDDPAYKIPGWGMQAGTPKREVTDWAAARNKLEEFIDGAKLDSLANYSITAVEKLLGDSIGVRGMKLKVQLALVLGDLLTQKYPAPTLKRLKGEPKIERLPNEHDPLPVGGVVTQQSSDLLSR